MNQLWQKLEGKTLAELVEIKGRAERQRDVMERWVNLADRDLYLLTCLRYVIRVCSTILVRRQEARAEKVLASMERFLDKKEAIN